MSFLEAVASALTGMSPEQVNKESGGRQKDAQGNTLVGRHRDGSLPPPAQRAYGIAQMQIGTAKSAAQRAGIPWDETKFMNDAAYNRSLGDSHMNYLRKKYGGDDTKAQAAYHSGEGTVDRLIKTRGSDWASGLGPEGKGYIGVAGSNGGSGSAGNIAPLEIPDILRETGRTTGAGATNGNDTVTATQMAPQIMADADLSRNRAVTADNVITNAITDLQSIQTRETQNLADRNERVNDILLEQGARTQEAQARMAPLFQQRRGVIEQKRHLASMNPLERAFKGLFDPNYDKSSLNEVQAGIDEEIEHNGKEYATMLGLQDNLLKIVESSYQGLSMESALESQHLNQNIEIAGKSFSAASALMSADMGKLSAADGIRASQVQLAKQVIDELTPGQIDTFHQQAKESPDGTVVVNGATLSEGMLLQAAKSYGEQQLRLEQVRMSAATQNLALKDRAEEDLLGTMTRSQIEEAMRNGGMYKGTQLPLDKLGAHLQQRMTSDAALVSGTMAKGSTETLSNMTQTLANTSRIAGLRAVQMTGGQPQELIQFMNSAAPKLNQMAQRLRETTDPSQKQLLAQQYQQEVQGLYQQQQKIVDGIADRWAGNNKALKPLAVSFLSGTPLNGEDSARGIIAMVRGGQRFANTSPEATAALAAAKRVIQQFDSQNNKPGQLPWAQKQNAKEKETELLRNVTKAVGESYTNSQYNAIIRSAPEVAKKIGHLGQNLDSTILQQAIAAGDKAGYEQMAAQLGISAQESQVLFDGGAGAADIWKRVQGNAGGRNLEQLGAQLSMRQSMNTIRYLDQNHQRIGKFTAGAVYANLLANPRFSDMAGQMIAAQGQKGFGDFAISSLGTGGVVGQIAAAGQVAQMGYNQLITNRGMQAAAKSQQYNGDPMRRTATVLGAIPDLQPSEEQALLAAVRPVVTQQMKQHPGAAGALAMSIDFTGQYAPATQAFDAVRNTITNGKFQDPTLEKIRQKAAKYFDEYSRVTDSAFDRFGNYTHEGDE